MKIFPGIIFRYILKKLLMAFFVISPIIIMMVWLVISIRYINLIVSDDVSLISFFKLISCVFPEIAGTILPICSLIASIVVLYRMQSDKEILVFMTSGKSVFSIFSPVLTFAIFTFSIVLYLLTTLSPYAYKNFVNIQEKIQNQISMSIIKPGVFNVLGNSIIYIGSKTEDSISDVFISYIPKDKKAGSNIITAKNGNYLVRDEKLYISLDKGYRQELDEKNSVVSTLKFDNFSYDVTQFVKRYSQKVQKPYQKTQRELISEAKNLNDTKLKMKYISEYHSRLTMPFIAIINSIIVAIFMINPQNRGKRGIFVFKSFMYGIFCHITIMTLINMSAKQNKMIYMNYTIICFLIIVLSLILVKKRKTS